MHSSEHGANARVFFDEADAAIESAAAEKDVIEQRGHLIGSKKRE
jgi:hypothetical protein